MCPCCSRPRPSRSRFIRLSSAIRIFPAQARDRSRQPVPTAARRALPRSGPYSCSIRSTSSAAPSRRPSFARCSSSRQSSENSAAPSVAPFDFSVCAARRSSSASCLSRERRSVARSSARRRGRCRSPPRGTRRPRAPAGSRVRRRRSVHVASFARPHAPSGRGRARFSAAASSSRADRLRHVVVHPRREARFAILLHRVRRHRDDAGPRLRRPALADPARGVETVQLGHLHVHQHDVVGLSLERLQRLEPVRRDVGAVAELLEQRGARPSGSPRCPRRAGSAATMSPASRRSSRRPRSASAIARRRAGERARCRAATP